jgi:hypothetical protein
MRAHREALLAPHQQQTPRRAAPPAGPPAPAQSHSSDALTLPPPLPRPGPTPSHPAPRRQLPHRARLRRGGGLLPARAAPGGGPQVPGGRRAGGWCVGRVTARAGWGWGDGRKCVGAVRWPEALLLGLVPVDKQHVAASQPSVAVTSRFAAHPRPPPHTPPTPPRPAPVPAVPAADVARG